VVPRSRALITLLLILALGLSGCGGRESSSRRSTDSAGSSAASSDSKRASDSTKSSGSTESSTGEEPASDPAAAVPAPTLPPNYVRASVATNGPDDPSLRDCGMTRGEVCKAQFRGRFLLQDHPSGAIEVAVFEDDASEPAYRAKLPIKQRGGSQFFVDLPFKISNTVKKLSFKSFLLGPGGEVIDEWGTQTFDVP
jgi:hypothetical protein